MLLTIPKPEQCTCSCGSLVKSRKGGLEVKSGQLCMIQVHDNKVRKVSVFVRIYRNRSRFEHYAVISRNQTFTNNSTFVSLKNSVVRRCDTRDNALEVVPYNVEGTKVTFETKDSKDIEEWLSAFNTSYGSFPKKGGILRIVSPDIPRTPLMPSVEEDEEETD